MKINKQLFEDVLSGKLKGTFVLRNGDKVLSSEVDYTGNYTFPIYLNGCSYTEQGRFDLRFDLLTKNHYLDIVDFIPNTDMKENELTIEIPNGKIVDWEESKKQNKIVLKDNFNKPNLSYGDVCRKLFGNQQHYHITHDGQVEVAGFYRCNIEPNAAKTRHQLECILAKNKLANVAKYLNNGWKSDCYNRDFGYFICKLSKEIEIVKRDNYKFNNNVIFKSKEIAQQAIEILGEETVKFALEPLGI